MVEKLKTALMDLLFEPDDTHYGDRQEADLLSAWEAYQPNYDFIFKAAPETAPIPRFTDYQFNTHFTKRR